jgi:phage regulator Rha-like protein
MSEKHTGASQSGAHALTTTTRATARTMSSREIAELVEARHNDVVATIERLFAKGLLRSSRETRREMTGGRPVEVYDLIERDTHLVVSGYSDEHRARVIDRWQELEAGAPKPAELSRMDILRLAMESEEARIRAEAERDEAIRTKALIGSKREATAMATASAAKREAAQLRDALGVNSRHATVIAVQRATGKKHDWLPLRRWCRANGLEAVDVPDARYGTAKAWPAGAWSACHGVDLAALFGEVAA